jgi:hypothetical protein
MILIVVVEGLIGFIVKALLFGIKVLLIVMGVFFGTVVVLSIIHVGSLPMIIIGVVFPRITVIFS